MDRSDLPLDEYTLAAFLSGSLSPEARAAVVRQLAADADTRELLAFAAAAYAAASEAEEMVEEAPSPETPSRKAAPPRRILRPAAGGDRRPARAPRRTLTRVAGAFVLVFALGFGLRLALGPAPDALRNQPPAEPVLVVDIDDDLDIRWQPVEGAQRYRIVVFDPQAVEVVARLETTATRLAPGTELSSSLRAALVGGRPYTLRIDALDDQNRIVERSDAQTFTFRP